MSRVEANVCGTIATYYERARHNLSKRDALAELVDNAVDAGAKRIDIELGRDRIVIEDDGCGCASFAKLTTLNGSNDDAGKQTGRFGQGLKVAAIRLGDVLAVDSRTGRQRLTFALHWRTYDGGEVGDRVMPHRGRAGTRIEITEIADRPGMADGRMHKHDRDLVARELAEVYRPALQSGTIITLDGAALAPAPVPPLREQATAEIVFPDGRAASVTAGILTDGGRPGIDVFYRIRRVCQLPAPASTTGFYALVELRDRPGANVRTGPDGVWRLGLHKTELAPEQSAELRAAIAERFADLVRKSASEPYTLEHMSLVGDRATRSGGKGRGQDHGEGKNGKGSRGQQAEDAEGKVHTRGGIRFVLDTLDNDAELGQVRDGEIALNSRNAFSEHLWSARNTKAASDALAVVGGVLLESSERQGDMLVQRRLRALGRALAAFHRRRSS